MTVATDTGRSGRTRELETLSVGLLLIFGWLVLASMAFGAIYLLIPIALGYGLLARAQAIREKRVYWLIAVTLAVASLLVFAFMLWVSLNQQTVIYIQK
jgi:hypothetical protein